MQKAMSQMPEEDEKWDKVTSMRCICFSQQCMSHNKPTMKGRVVMLNKREETCLRAQSNGFQSCTGDGFGTLILLPHSFSQL